MYRLLIADDEQITRKAIRMLVDKYVPEITEIFEADSGRAAIELAANVHPDLICMDIKMPGIDGLEAARSICTTAPNTSVIIISAYDEFSFAKDALSLGINHYLLKPISKTEFLAAVQDILEKKGLQKKRADSHYQLKEQVYKVQRELDRQITYSLMIGDMDRLEDYRYFETIGGTYGGFSVVIDFQKSPTEEDTVKVYCGRNFRRIQKVLDRPEKGIAFNSLGTRIVIFLYNYTQTQDHDAWVNSQLHWITALLQESGEVNAAVGYGPYEEQMERLSLSYCAAARATIQGGKTKGILLCPPLKRFSDYKYPMKLESEIFRAIASEDRETAIEIFSRLLSYVVAYSDGNQEFIYQQIFIFSIGLARFCVEKGIEDTSNLGLEYMYDTIAIHNWCISNIDRCLKNLRDMKEDYSDDLIGEAIAFIEENYSSVISLSDISGKVNLSSFYFTKLFKAKTGMTFVEYLTNYRMKVAKKLLEENMEMKIQDVGEHVGYTDYKYFCKCFRKQTGVTPASYRSQLSPGREKDNR